jgi:hypothetical protein
MMIQVDLNEFLSFVVSACTSFSSTQKGHVCRWIDFVQKSAWILRMEEMKVGRETERECSMDRA